MNKVWSWDSQSSIIVKIQAEYTIDGKAKYCDKEYFMLSMILMAISTSTAKNNSDKWFNQTMNNENDHLVKNIYA